MFDNLTYFWVEFNKRNLTARYLVYHLQQAYQLSKSCTEYHCRNILIFMPHTLHFVLIFTDNYAYQKWQICEPGGISK